MPKIMPITELRKTTEMSNICHSSNEPIYITKNGYGDMVIMSIQAYENLIDAVSVDMSIKESEEEFSKSGMLNDHSDVFDMLRGKYGE